jgi:short-subunit dehydrogenase
LWCELRPRGIDVLSLVLGVTDTPARTRSGLPAIAAMPISTCDEVAQQALDNLTNGGPVYVPPPFATMFQSMCSTPRRQLAERLSGMTRRSPLQKTT